MKKKGKSSFVTTVIIIVVAVSIVAGWSWHSIPNYSLNPGFQSVEKAYYEKRSDFMVEVTGAVVRILSASGGGPGLQRFTIRLENGQVLQVNHEHGKTDTIPLAAHDVVRVRGEYFWTETGGTIHGTAYDPSLRRQHGWVEHNGKKYD